MQIPYNPDTPALIVMNEIKHYMALSTLKNMLFDGVITADNYRKSTVAIAEKYGVLKYDI